MARMELITHRLVLREFRATDHAGVHAFATDREVIRFMDWGPNSPADTTAFLVDAIATGATSPRLRYPLAIVHDGGLIGSIELRVVSRPNHRADIGYVLSRGVWGRGYATEAGAALIAYGFEHLGLHKVAATCDPANAGSAAVLRKLGLAQEGHLRDHLLIRGEWRDRLVFGRLSPQTTPSGPGQG